MSGGLTRVVTRAEMVAMTECAGYQPANAKIATVLAGQPARLYSHVTGDPGPDTDPLAPRNPQGTQGIDMSGPPYGSAPRHPLFWMGGHKPDSGAWSRQNRRIIGGTDNSIAMFVATPWIRPHTRDPFGPYTQAHLYVIAYNTGATASTITVEWTAALETGAQSFTMAANTNEQGFSLRQHVGLVPGRNRIEFKFSSSTTAVGTYLVGFGANQIAKRFAHRG